MARPITYFKAGNAFGASAGKFVHGTGGTPEWWKNFDKAKVHFDVHGNLDSFRDRQWIGRVRAEYQGNRLKPDQLHFLREIAFDFAPKVRGSYARKVNKGSKLERTLELKARFTEGAEGLSAPEKAELRGNLRYYRTRYIAGLGGSKTHSDLGTDDEITFAQLISDLS